MYNNQNLPTCSDWLDLINWHELKLFCGLILTIFCGLCEHSWKKVSLAKEFPFSYCLMVGLLSALFVGHGFSNIIM